jgi:hypothetical protein
MAHPQTKNEEHPFHDLLIVLHRGAVRKLKKIDETSVLVQLCRL